MSRQNSIIGVDDLVYDRNGQRVTAESLKGRNRALDFVIKAADVKHHPKRLKALHALVHTGKLNEEGRRGSNASFCSTDSTYSVAPDYYGGLKVHRRAVSNGQRPGAKALDKAWPNRRGSLDEFSWESGKIVETCDEKGNIKKIVDASITIPGIPNISGENGLIPGDRYNRNGLHDTTHTPSRRGMLKKLAEAKAGKVQTVQNAQKPANDAKRRSS